jgi:hypothetical protein
MPWNNITEYVFGETVEVAVWEDLVENNAFQEEIGAASRSSDLAITATSVGAAQEIMTLGALTYEAVPTLFEVWIPRISAGNAAFHLILREGSTVIETLLDGVANESEQGKLLGARLTPTAGSRTYNVAGWRAAGTDWTVRAGTGGTTGDSTTFGNARMRAVRIPT